MKQVFLSGKGEVEVFDVPVPGRLANAVLVRNAFSLISPGTEGSAVSRRGGWLGVIEKAAQSRERVQQVWDLTRTQGPTRTWEMVRGKLDDYTALGYSSAGQVVEVSGDDLPYKPGDLVACIGSGFATHSEYAVVPANLVVPLPEGVDCAEAAFGALGCIAMQGVRRLELSPGEIVGVLGLGLIGQIAVQLLVAMGYRVVGMDLSSRRAKQATEIAGIEAWGGDDADSLRRVLELTDGRGLDGVLICAASSSDQPINLAFDLCRKRGRVSLVGDVGLSLTRAKMYQKELELRMSTSYGPGRYDDEYEVGGHDYPFAFVRWTEQRNLEYMLYLLKAHKLNLQPLISYRCPVDQAVDGYARIKQGDPDTFGVVLDYGPLPVEPQPVPKQAYTTRRSVAPAVTQSGVIRLGVIGAGGFTKNVHIPNLLRLPKLFSVGGVASRTGATAEVVARRAGASIATSDYHSLLGDPAIDAVLIATRHAAHARIALEALEAGKHVFIEKPMCLTVEEGRQIVDKAAETGLIVRVGFNRRFAPHLNTLRNAVGTLGPRMLTCRVNIGAIANDWSNTPSEGGRLLGEGVHFFDLCNWFMGAEPTTISAVVAGAIEPTNPNIMVQILYPNQCVAQVIYTALGHRDLGKEYFEAFGNGHAAQSDDYHDLSVYGSSAQAKGRAQNDKGHLAELEEFAAAIQGRTYPITGADGRAGLIATWMSLAAYESASLQRAMHLEELEAGSGEMSKDV